MNPWGAAEYVYKTVHPVVCVCVCEIQTGGHIHIHSCQEKLASRGVLEDSI